MMRLKPEANRNLTFENFKNYLTKLPEFTSFRYISASSGTINFYGGVISSLLNALNTTIYNTLNDKYLEMLNKNTD